MPFGLALVYFSSKVSRRDLDLDMLDLENDILISTFIPGG